MKKSLICFFLLSMLFVGCAGKNIKPEDMRVTLSNQGAFHQELVALSDKAPEVRPVIAIYHYQDVSGQFKADTMSKAVTQGGYDILVKALLDSGCFRVMERDKYLDIIKEQSIQNVATSRSLSFATEKADYIIKGGIISYEPNTSSGGIGANYLGIGANTEFRVDEIKISLRLIEVSTGETIEAITVARTIFSKKIDFTFFRFVSLNELGQGETGYANNEPKSLVVTEAIEKGVLQLFHVGRVKKLW